MSSGVQLTDTGVPEPVADNPVLRKLVWNKMHKYDDNWMASVVGPTGSGKSWAAIRLAEVLDPDFTVDQVAFSVEEFMRLVTDESLGRGSIIVFEEASVEANAQEWWSKSNKVLRQVLDTWRHQNRGAIFTHPSFDQLDKNARGRMSALIQMVEKDEEEGFTRAKYKYCQQNSDTGKIYKKYPRLDGKVYRRLQFQPPSEQLRKEYETIKREYTQNLNEELLEELLEEKREEEAEEVTPQQISKTILEKETLDQFIADNHGQEYIDRDMIEMEFDVGSSKSKKAKKLLQREVDADLM